MKNRLLVLSLALISLLGLTAFTFAVDPISDLLKKLEEFAKKYPKEKIHIHLDKPYYALGDDIWLKAYVIDSKTAAPSTISNVLYVELINEQNELTEQIILPMKNGVTWGDFKLSDSLTEGNYRIRAYTQWMRNAGPNFFFDKSIKIANQASSQVFAKASHQIGDQITSTIQFSDQSGKPFKQTEISYEVALANGSSTRGKGITDNNGNITVPVASSKTNPSLSGKIVTTLKLENKQVLTKVVPIRIVAANTDVQFFPEGGNLVQNFPNKIGVKSVNAQGRGEDISGTIIESDGTEITQFETSYLGMGSFSLNPMPNKTYRAKIKFKDGTTKIIDLPNSLPSAYLLTINTLDSTKMAIKVLRSQELMDKGELDLIAQQNGIVCFATKIPVKMVAALSIPKNTLPSGIITFTLFSANNIPVAERIVFVNNSADLLKVDITNLKQDYLKRENVNLNFAISNNSNPTEGNFSVAVTNETIITTDLENESNILTSLLLTSDLKGYVEKPNHYFLSDSPKTRTELDNLLLTQGWRKIDWESLMKDQLPPIVYEAETSLKIRGTLTTRNNIPIADGKISLFSSSNGVFANSAQSDVNGKFLFDMLDFNDSTKFTLQGSTEKKQSNLKIKLDITPKQIITPSKNTGDFEVNVNESLRNYLEKGETYFDDLTKRGLLNKTIQLKEVKIATEKAKKVERSANLNGPGNADAIITADEILTSVTLSQALTKVMGITVSGGLAYLNLAKASTMSAPVPMSIVIDGIMMDKSYSLGRINAGDVETIEVLRSAPNLVMYGVAGGAGVLVITTKLGLSKQKLLADVETDSKITYQPKGYQVSREFYVPKYDAIADQKLDLRPLIYWNPYIVPETDGKLTINFTNSDQIGTYRVVIEGMDNNGSLARKVFTYKVN